MVTAMSNPITFSVKMIKILLKLVKLLLLIMDMMIVTHMARQSIK